MSDDKILLHKKEIDEYEGDADNRQHIRFPVCIAVKYSGASFDYCEYILNISNGGVFIMTDKPLPVGEHIDMQFHIPNNKVLFELHGRIVWINKEGSKHPRGMGIEILHCSEDCKKALNEYLSAKRHLFDIKI